MVNSAGFVHGLRNVFSRLRECFWNRVPAIIRVLSKRGAHFENRVFVHAWVNFSLILCCVGLLWGATLGAKVEPKVASKVDKRSTDVWIAFGRAWSGQAKSAPGAQEGPRGGVPATGKPLLQGRGWDLYWIIAKRRPLNHLLPIGLVGLARTRNSSLRCNGYEVVSRTMRRVLSTLVDRVALAFALFSFPLYLLGGLLFSVLEMAKARLYKNNEFPHQSLTLQAAINIAHSTDSNRVPQAEPNMTRS